MRIQSPSSGACSMRGRVGPPLPLPTFSRPGHDPDGLIDHQCSEAGLLVPIFVTNKSLFSVRPHSPLSTSHGLRVFKVELYKTAIPLLRNARVGNTR